MSETKTKSPIKAIAPQTEWLASRLRKLKIGERISYDDLSTIVGADIHSSSALLACLRSARKIVERDDGIATECVHGEGIERLDDRGIAATVTDRLVRIRRMSGRNEKRGLLADPTKLEQDERLQFLGAMAVNRLVRMASTVKGQNAVQKVIGGATQVPSLEHTIRALRGEESNGEKKD